MSNTTQEYRLPRTVIPTRYEITLTPDLEAAVFTGSETITVEVNESVKEIVLNSDEITITSVTFRQGKSPQKGRVSVDAERQRATLSLEQPTRIGKAELDIEFAGTLNDQLVGFYKSTFIDVDGVKQSIATTQFEATDARRAFPCWDEPDLKAVFSITLVIPNHLMAVSNTAEAERRTLEGGRVSVHFADTMIMSTYLVAFVVGPFEATDPFDVGGVPVRIITPRGKLHLSKYATDCAVFCTRYLTDYYGIPYPGDKIDHVAIPDFAFGAMENLGCITYRESALLLDPERSSQLELLRVLDVVGHELAHMWFGDLVTMKWWDGIWLNEAFASFMELKATDAHRPEWKRWLAFGAVERPWAFGVDALRSTRPVEFEVGSPEEANEMFDALTYGKGSAVLRMIEQYIGEEDFRRGVGSYLRRHAYKNTVTADLWQGLDEASGQPVGEIMDTWILQRGYPQLEVSVSDGVVSLDQRRYLTVPDETDQTLWKIPIQLRGESVNGAFESKLILEEGRGEVVLPSSVSWVMANAGGHGFYRVHYQPDLLANLVDRLTELSDLERFTVVDDAWAFVESGQLGAPAYFDLIGAYRDEREQAIWQTVLAGLGAASLHLVTEEARPAFGKLVGELLLPTFQRLGWQMQAGETDLTRRLRGQMVGAMGRLAEDQEVIERCRMIVGAGREKLTTSDPELVRAALFVVAANGTEADYELFMAGYRNPPTPQDELRYLQALTVFDSPDLTVRTVTNAIDGSIRSQDATWVLSATFGNRRNGKAAWAEVRRRWDAVLAFPSITIRRLVEGLPALSVPEVAADVAAFFAETPLPAAAKALKQNLERLQANVALRKRESDSLGDYLKRWV